MITYWLVIMISIAGGPWKAIENEKMPDRLACMNAVASHVQEEENFRVVDQHHNPTKDEYEVAFTCSIHHSGGDPA